MDNYQTLNLRDLLARAGLKPCGHVERGRHLH